MAVNALGLPLQLQASALQIQDLLGGLQPGDLLKGRLVELLPDGKAVLNLRGQNLVAQLPAGQTLSRGAILDLQVTQLASPDPGKAASLTLRLLTSQAPASSPNTAPTAPAASQPLPPQAQLDQAISAARLPQTPVTQAVARTLAQLGVPLTPQALQAAVSAVESLLANESAPAPASAPSTLPAPVQDTLQNALSELRVAAQLTPPGPVSINLQQAARAVEAALQGPAPLPAAPAQVQGAVQTQVPAQATAAPAPSSSAPAPQTALAPAAALPPAPAPSAAPAAAAAPVATALVHVQEAVSQVLAQPQAPQVQTLTAALQELAQALSAAPAQGAPSAAAVPSAPAQGSNPTTVGSQPALGGANPGPAAVQVAPAPGLAASVPLPPASPAQVLIQRESVAPLLSLASQLGPPPTVQTLIQAVSAQLSALQDPQSSASQQLVRAVQIQNPAAEASAILDSARQTLTQVQAQLQAQPEPAATLQAPQFQQLLADAGIAAPRVSLQSLPAETVAEAVTWLQARDLPPQRPLVEAVAVFLQQDQNALPAAQRAVDQAQTLPPALLDQQPNLREAVAQAQQALHEAAIQPEQPGLAQRLQQWAQQQGFSLESSLLDSAASAPRSAAPSAPAALPGQADSRPALRPALQELELQLHEALKSPLAQTASASSTLQGALKDAQSANRAFSAVPLQAQGAPAFDTVHLPLPVVMGQDLGGQLSVTWRQGRDRQLDEKDPVSVAVALNTGSLGKVKVLLQVWKDAASARVVAEDQPTADFLADGAADLKDGFAERTPFKLQALDFAVDAGREPGAGGPSDTEPPRGGLTLSA